MTRMLLQTIEQIGREKNIPPDVIIGAVEEAMAVAAKKFYKTEEEMRATLNRETGEVEVHAVKKVVDDVDDADLEISVTEAIKFDSEANVGDDVYLPRATEGLGRIAAQAAKQVIFQKVRDAERENIYDEFVERVGELITGLVKRFERGDMIVDLGRTEALLPRREQSRAEHYNIGDRIRVVIADVLKVARGPQVVVSRVSPELLIRLFEMEVPEIFDGTVNIKGAVREGGDRAKVAVHSVEPDVDPVGACVGMRGARVQSVIRELRGEKIDIVQWDADLQQYATNSLKPARVNRVTVIDGDGRHLEVVVDEDQLSLAIGKRGQNVRLAGKLLNATIDIKSEEDKKRDVEQAILQMAAREEALEVLKGVGPKTAEALLAAGVRTVGEAIDAGTDGLLAVSGIGPKAAEKILGVAEAYLASLTPDEPEIQEAVVDDSLTEAAEDSVSANLSGGIETDEAAAADDIAMEAGVGAEAEAVAASDDEDEIPAPTDTDEEEVVETSA